MGHVTIESPHGAETYVMPKPTFHNLSADKRARIIDAAVDELGAWPYRLANLDRVAAAAGVSKGSLYQYFEGKADLYTWLLGEHVPARKLAALGAAAPPEDAGVWVALEAAFLAGARFAAAEPALTRLGVRFYRDRDEPELAPIAAAHRRQSHAWLLALLEAGRARGELREDVDLDALASLLAHALGEGMLEQLARRLGLTLDALLEAPERMVGLGDDALRAEVDAVLRVLRHGAAPRTGRRR